MDENEPDSAPELLRFGLLPDGGKDLQRIEVTPPSTPSVPYTLPMYPQGSPATVKLRDLLLVSDLAEAIHLPVQEVIRVFHSLHFYYCPDSLLDFATASSLCSLCSVEALPAD